MCRKSMCVQEGVSASHRNTWYVSPQSTQSTAAMMRLLQEVLELLPESGRQAAQRLPWRLMDKIRVRAASTASASFPSILG